MRHGRQQIPHSGNIYFHFPISIHFSFLAENNFGGSKHSSSMASLELKCQNTGSCLAQMSPIPNVIFHTWIMMCFQSKILESNNLCGFRDCAITCWLCSLSTNMFEADRASEIWKKPDSAPSCEHKGVWSKYTFACTSLVCHFSSHLSFTWTHSIHRINKIPTLQSVRMLLELNTENATGNGCDLCLLIVYYSWCLKMTECD